ncbi:hypothetical protein HDU91_006232 [Kappamyces sp. JEL0680]|nr:hypothetical protein HDU91_006232 [Kappamyces sp. JEL0680]
MTVDFVVFGIGFPTEEYQGTRYNAGYTFCDYLANCVAMQSILLDQAAANAPNDPTQLSIPENFQRPRFMRLADSAGADSRVQKRFRLLIVKPLVADASQTGLVLTSVLRQYNVVDVAKKVVVVYGDPQVLPGSISLAHESDVNRTQASPALASICSQLGNEFVRIRMGLGQPSQPSLDAFLLEVIQPSKEMDVFGYCLDVTGQAVQHYAAFQGKKGTTIVAPYRGVDDDRRHLKVMADLGKLVQLRFDLRNEGQIVESLRHSDIVYNCIGRSFTTKNFSYDAVHHQGARRLARLAKEAGVQKFVHVSALNADVDSKSAFLKSKALGEIAVREEFPEATIVRPSWMYGYEDRFWNKMGWFVKWAPFSIIPLPDWGHATMRPVYVADVAIALSAMTKEDSAVGKTVELYGPSEYTYKGLVELFEDASMRPHHAVPVPKLLLK